MGEFNFMIKKKKFKLRYRISNLKQKGVLKYYISDKLNT